MIHDWNLQLDGCRLPVRTAHYLVRLEDALGCSVCALVLRRNVCGRCRRWSLPLRTGDHRSDDGPLHARQHHRHDLHGTVRAMQTAASRPRFFMSIVCNARDYRPMLSVTPMLSPGAALRNAAVSAALPTGTKKVFAELLFKHLLYPLALRFRCV